jgi:hypothetical protein
VGLLQYAAAQATGPLLPPVDSQHHRQQGQHNPLMESPHSSVNAPKIDPSNAEVPHKRERSSRDVFWVILCWVGVAVMLYVLSLGPVMLVVQKKSISPFSSTYHVLGTFYWPIEWAGKKIPMLKPPMGKYLHLWAPELYDRNGYSTGRFGFYHHSPSLSSPIV